MKEIYSNINIVGGGLIGAFAAHSLSKIGFSISIIEKSPPYKNNNNLDHRTVAISEGTKTFLEKMDLWNEIKKFAQPIKKIKVINRHQSSKLEFDNKRRQSNLGYIVKNKHLLNIIYKNLRSNKNIKIYNNTKLTNFQNSKDAIKTNLNTISINSDLNIAADGKNSFVKQFYKTPFFLKDYKKSALVVNFIHQENHNSTAFEYFYKNGPLAILPMQSINGNFMSSIVWTNKRDYLEQITKLSDRKLISILDKESQYSVGKIKKIITKQIFSLTAHLNTSFYQDRTIYIGDSAHSFHPIAGQGWNLGMKDVENLYNLANKYKSLGIELGDKFFCKEYHNNNYYNAYRLYQVTDKLDSIFQNQNSLVTFGRNFGINFLQNNKKIKNIISDFAMGVN
ncbi:FAD-dependent monooxygenase [Pelagibacteraceae bacterium]|nr:FAD-dependent monooxygenase [Pelagibacteraceae bacterium]